MFETFSLKGTADLKISFGNKNAGNISIDLGVDRLALMVERVTIVVTFMVNTTNASVVMFMLLVVMMAVAMIKKLTMVVV